MKGSTNYIDVSTRKAKEVAELVEKLKAEQDNLQHPAEIAYYEEAPKEPVGTNVVWAILGLAAYLYMLFLLIK